MTSYITTGIGNANSSIDPFRNSDIQIDGGQQSVIAALMSILFELRIHSEYLSNIASGVVNKDDPLTLRIDQITDPDFTRST